MFKIYQLILLNLHRRSESEASESESEEEEEEAEEEEGDDMSGLDTPAGESMVSGMTSVTSGMDTPESHIDLRKRQFGTEVTPMLSSPVCALGFFHCLFTLTIICLCIDS